MKGILVKEMIDWKEEYISLVRSIGSATFGKERWFLQDNGLWHDRMDGKEISIDELHNRIYKEVKCLDEN